MSVLVTEAASTPGRALSALPPAHGVPADAPPAAFKPEPSLPVPAGWPFADAYPRTSGAGRLLSGSFQWSDFIHDDYGARGTSNRTVTALSGSAGSYAYPEGAAYQRNAADIFRVGVGLDDDATYWRVDWNTLVDPSVPIASFAFDSDASAATGAPRWASVPNLASAGIDRELVVSAAGATLVDSVSGARTPIALGGGSVTVDSNARSFVARVPRSLLDVQGTWRIRVVTGLADASGSAFAPVPVERGGSPVLPPVYNVGFRTHVQEDVRDLNWWMEGAQAQALLLGDIGRFAADVAWEALSTKATTPEPKPTGFQNRWYVTSLELGQGVVRQDAGAGPLGDFRPNYLGRIQPYFAYVPTGYDGSTAAPLRFMLHAYQTNHNHFGLLSPTFVEQTCEQWMAICVTPLGRGPDGWYQAEAELDLWEVWNRVASDFLLDPESTSLTGYSMGGHGTSRMTHRYPDLFARASVLAGPVGDVPELENLRWVPTMITHGIPDPGALQQAEQMAAALDRLGYRYRYELYAAEDHIGYSMKDGFSSTAAWMADHRRALDPGRVSLTWSAATDRPDLGFTVNGAYWVRDVAVREAGRQARFEGTSAARPDPAVTALRSTSATAPGDPSPAIVRQLDWVLGPTALPAPAIDLRFVNIGQATVRMARAGISPGRPAVVDVTTDGPTSFTLADLAPGSRVFRDGVLVTVVGGQRQATIALPHGASRVTVERGEHR
ncbi:MAG: peptidase [Actinobacteria bacterium]|nr:peptidase [Actinomycetota bacterium]